MVLAFGMSNAVGVMPEEGDQLEYIGNGDYGVVVSVNVDFHGSKFWPYAWAGYYLLEDVIAQQQYNAFCVDFGTDIFEGNMLWADGDLDTVLTEEEACQVNFIINMFRPESAVDPDLEAAAIQSAIWNVITQDEADPFMGDDDSTTPYDAWDEVTYGSAIRDRAMEILAAIPEPCVYPVSISLEPESQAVSCPCGEAELTATVLDNEGNGFEGATVMFSTSAGTLSDTEVVTDVNGEAKTTLTLGGASSATVTACVWAGEGILIWDDENPPNPDWPSVNVQDLVVPHDPVCDCATVECCYYPQVYTPGFWKNNIGKQIGLVKGKGIQVPLSDIIAYLNSISSQYGGTYAFLSFTGTDLQKATQAYNILSYGGSDMIRKAQKMILSLLLSVEWYDDHYSAGFYLNGCIDIPGDDDPTIGEALEDILEWYDDGNYEDAKDLADWINNQPWGGYP